VSDPPAVVQIRRILAHEGMRLREIRLRALAEAPTAFGSTLAETEQRPDAVWSKRASGAAAGNIDALFVAEDGGRWLGLAGGVVDEETPPGEVELASMWVDPAVRGRGLGQQLIEAVVAWARAGGAGQLRLWVTVGNAPAIALYERHGFAFSGDTAPHPSNPALREALMLRPLPPEA